MAALVEKMAHAEGTEMPWHGDSDVLATEETLSVAKAAERGGVDFEVEKIPIYTHTGALGPLGFAQTDKGFATRRKSDGRILGIVGPRYEVMQNVDALTTLIQPFLDAGQARITSLGSLRGGEVVFGQAMLNRPQDEVRPGDGVVSYIHFGHGHDGSMSIHAGLTPQRVVCMNTLRMAHSSFASKLIKIKHTKEAGASLQAVAELIDVANQELTGTLESYRKLAQKPISNPDKGRYVAKVFDVELAEAEAGQSESTNLGGVAARISNILATAQHEAQAQVEEVESGISTRMMNILTQVAANIESGQGNTGETYWDAYNGVTEYLSHQKGKNPDARAYSLHYGASATLNKRALEVAMEMAS